MRAVLSQVESSVMERKPVGSDDELPYTGRSNCYYHIIRYFKLFNIDH